MEAVVQKTGWPYLFSLLQNRLQLCELLPHVVNNLVGALQAAYADLQSLHHRCILCLLILVELDKQGHEVQETSWSHERSAHDKIASAAFPTYSL